MGRAETPVEYDDHIGNAIGNIGNIDIGNMGRAETPEYDQIGL